jgi:transposase InsO family protein
MWAETVEQHHLPVLLDLYSRRVVGWAMGQRITGELAEQALTIAVAKQASTAGLVHHSDRSSQDAARSYQRLLDEYGLIPGMSCTGNGWDTACVESFFGTLKRELIHHRLTRTRDEAKQDIFEYFEVFYDRQRRHSHSTITPRLSVKRGRLLHNPVSTDLEEGHLE